MSFVQHEPGSAPQPRHRAASDVPEIPPTRDVKIVREVVFWLGLAQSILGALTASTAFVGLHPAVPGVLATITLVLGAVQASLEKRIQEQITWNPDVVEARVGDDVVAGEANSMVPAGERIRDVNDTVPPQSIPPSG